MSEKLETPGTAIASLVTGIIGLIYPFCFLAVFFCIPTLICGHAALRKIKRNPGTPGRGITLAGVILGYIQLALSVAGILFISIIIFISMNEDNNQEDKTINKINQLNGAVNTYHNDTGLYPETLICLLEHDETEGWSGPYIDNKCILKDCWDTPFTYQTNDISFQIISSGPDKILDTTDDIQNYYQIKVNQPLYSE